MIYRERLVVADSIVKNFEPNQIEKLSGCGNFYGTVLELFKYLLLRKKQGSYLYSRLRDGNGCTARTVEPECLMPSK